MSVELIAFQIDFHSCYCCLAEVLKAALRIIFKMKNIKRNI